jgi:hypothetical protein
MRTPANDEAVPEFVLAGVERADDEHVQMQTLGQHPEEAGNATVDERRH